MEIASLTNLQLELLKIFSREISDSDLIELKEVIAQFFARKLIESANKSWKEKGWTEDKINELLNTHLRTSYNS